MNIKIYNCIYMELFNEYFNKVYYIASGGLEFIELDTETSLDFDIDIMSVHINTFGKFNNINISVVDTLPLIIINTDIYITYDVITKILKLKALHGYYDGNAITKIFQEIENISLGNDPSKSFTFKKNPIEGYYTNKCIELTANIINQQVLMNKPTMVLSKPYDVYNDITSGDLIRQIHAKENMDMILLVRTGEKSDTNEISNNIGFKYIKKGEDFKHVMKYSTNFSQALRLSGWMLNKKPILFLNNFSSMKLPAFIERIVRYTSEKPSELKINLKILLAHPRMKDGSIEVYKVL